MPLIRKEKPQATEGVQVVAQNRAQTVQPKPTDDGLRIDQGEMNRCDLIYGASGTGKTENLGLAAKYVWEKYGKITRLASADGGGWKPLQPYIDLGIIQPFSLNAAKTPLKVTMAIAGGYWPKMKADGSGKEYVPLDWRDVEGDEKNGIPGVGCMCFEGLTSFADAIFISLTRRKDIHIPETPKDSFVTDGDDYYGFSGRAHYGFVQNRIQEMVARANGLPFEKMVWTALENDGVDPETKETCYGPKVIGKALTGKAPAWFGDCIHLVDIDSGERVDDGRDDMHKLVKGGVKVKKIRAYMANHPHKSTGHMYSAKGRTSAWVGKDFPPFFDVVINDVEQKGLNWIYTQEDELAKKAASVIAANLTRKPPIEEFKLKGSVSVLELPENEGVIDEQVELAKEIANVGEVKKSN